MGSAIAELMPEIQRGTNPDGLKDEWEIRRQLRERFNYPLRSKYADIVERETLDGDRASVILNRGRIEAGLIPGEFGNSVVLADEVEYGWKSPNDEDHMAFRTRTDRPVEEELFPDNQRPLTYKDVLEDFPGATKRDIDVLTLTGDVIASKYGVTRRTATRWRRQAERKLDVITKQEDSYGITIVGPGSRHGLSRELVNEIKTALEMSKDPRARELYRFSYHAFAKKCGTSPYTIWLAVQELGGYQDRTNAKNENRFMSYYYLIPDDKSAESLPKAETKRVELELRSIREWRGGLYQNLSLSALAKRLDHKLSSLAYAVMELAQVDIRFYDRDSE